MMRLVQPVRVLLGDDVVPAELVFRGSDPLSVYLRIADEEETDSWRLSRELLDKVLTAEPGGLVGVPGADVVFIRENDGVKLSLYTGTARHCVLNMDLLPLRRLLAEIREKFHLEDTTVSYAVDALIASCLPPARPSDGR